MPFSYVSSVEGVADGPVNFGAELPESLSNAITESQDDIKEQVLMGNIKLVTHQLVDRTRAGDQNAMSLLIGIRQKAKNNPRAKYAYQCFREYASRKPAEKVDFGEDSIPSSLNLEELVTRATTIPTLSLAVTLADSPYSIQECLRVARACQGKRAVRRFVMAVKEAHALRQARAGSFTAWASDVEF